LKFLHFWLDSCIANKGEKFELEMACWKRNGKDKGTNQARTGG
jgi:hypothetical protein